MQTELLEFLPFSKSQLLAQLSFKTYFVHGITIGKNLLTLHDCKSTAVGRPTEYLVNFVLG